MKLLTRFSMILALAGLASVAQARPSVGVGGENCGGATVALASLTDEPEAPNAVPRLSQSIGRRIRARLLPTGELCVGFRNDVGILHSITFDSNVELTTLPGSALSQRRIDFDRRRITVYSGNIPSRQMSVRFVGSTLEVWIVVRRFRATPRPGSQP